MITWELLWIGAEWKTASFTDIPRWSKALVLIWYSGHWWHASIPCLGLQWILSLLIYSFRNHTMCVASNPMTRSPHRYLMMSAAAIRWNTLDCWRTWECAGQALPSARPMRSFFTGKDRVHSELWWYSSRVRPSGNSRRNMDLESYVEPCCNTYFPPKPNISPLWSYFCIYKINIKTSLNGCCEY